MKNDIFLVPGLRTPFARVDGPLRRLDAVALSVPVAQAMAAQAPQGAIDFAVWGTVAPNLGWSNIAREVWIDAKLDPTTPAFSTVLACSTSMVAVFEAAGMLGDEHQLACAGGVESMSRVQIGLKQGLSDWIRRLSQARSFGERLDRFMEIRASDVRLHVPSVANRATGKSMGEHCEEMAKAWGIRREDQDRIAFESHRRAVKAHGRGILRRPRGAGRGHGEGRHPARRQLAREARDAQARVRPHERPGHDHRRQRIAAHRRRRGDLGRDRPRALRRLPADRPQRAARRLGDGRSRHLPRRAADGAGLRDSAPARAPWPRARRDRPVGDPRGLRRAGAVQRGRARERGLPARKGEGRRQPREIPVGAHEPQRRQRRDRAPVRRHGRAHPLAGGEGARAMGSGKRAVVSICADGGLGTVALLES